MNKHCTAGSGFVWTSVCDLSGAVSSKTRPQLCDDSHGKKKKERKRSSHHRDRLLKRILISFQLPFFFSLSSQTLRQLFRRWHLSANKCWRQPLFWRIPPAKRALSLGKHTGWCMCDWRLEGLSWQGRGRVEQSITDRQIRAAMTSGN